MLTLLPRDSDLFLHHDQRPRHRDVRDRTHLFVKADDSVAHPRCSVRVVHLLLQAHSKKACIYAEDAEVSISCTSARIALITVSTQRPAATLSCPS